MTDGQIVQLLTERKEEALETVQTEYGAFLTALARRILGDPQDAEEVVNDTLLAAWETIPPQEPRSLKAYLSVICRHKALDRLDTRNSEKRGGGEATLAMEELEESLPDAAQDGRSWDERLDLKDLIRRFAASLNETEQRVFLLRYWYFLSVAETAKECSVSAANCKVILYRLRKKLKSKLEEEGMWHE